MFKHIHSTQMHGLIIPYLHGTHMLFRLFEGIDSNNTLKHKALRHKIKSKKWRVFSYLYITIFLGYNKFWSRYHIKY